jgi:cysteine-rich repeat protein
LEAVCGNGETESGEQCDDGNTEDGDGCSSECVLEDYEDDSDDSDEVQVQDGDQSSEEPSSDVVCGNGVIEEGEQCDSEKLGGKTCTDFGEFTRGSLACNDKCEWDTGACQKTAVCGNNKVETGEECDGRDFAGLTCEDYGYEGGVSRLSCNDCEVDTSNCKTYEEMSRRERMWDDMGEFVRENETFVGTMTAVPILTGTVSFLSTLGFSIFSLPYYILQFIFWLLNLLGIRKKGKPWGFVYNSVSKSPLPRAIVRLFSQDTLMETQVTDVNGVFHMTAKEGEYTMKVRKNGFKFPTRQISGDEDGPRKNVYKGELYKVKSDKEVMNLSVPMDPKKPPVFKAFLKKVWSYTYNVLKKINPIVITIGIIMSAIAYYFTGNIINLILLILNIVVLGLNLWVRYFEKTQWGHVVDINGNPLSHVEIGLFDKKYKRLIDTRITDEKGRYRFVVLGDIYILKPVKSGYVINDPESEAGYVVGEKVKNDIVINQQVVLREVD